MHIREIFQMALLALKTNKLRSGLTMLGVTIGVFSVIGVMTALSVISTSIEGGLNFLGSNLFQFAKYPVIETHGSRQKFAWLSVMTDVVCLKVFDGGNSVGYGKLKLQEIGRAHV